VKNCYDNDVSSVVRGEHRAIIKAHGTIDQPPRMIFTRKEYGNARYKYSSFYNLLDALALTHTLIFVGCGLDDPDTRMMLEKYANVSPHCRPHYIILPKGLLHNDIQDSTRQNLNLKVICYKPDNFHEELSDSIAELVTKVEAKRNELSISLDW
jgi:hypothetical protein